MTNGFNNWQWPNLIAHRGGGHLAPENTISALRTGYSYGYRMLEFDVRLTQDKVPILLHDNKITRTSNGKGNANEYSMVELLEFDFGSWFDKRYAGESVATLMQAAQFCIANNIHCNIELKSNKGYEHETGLIIGNYVTKLWSSSGLTPLISSFSEKALISVRESAPNLPRALITQGKIPSNWEEKLSELKCVGINIEDQWASADIIRAIRSKGYFVGVWTVNNTDRINELLNIGCNAIFTDSLLEACVLK